MPRKKQEDNSAMGALFSPRMALLVVSFLVCVYLIYFIRTSPEIRGTEDKGRPLPPTGFKGLPWMGSGVGGSLATFGGCSVM